MQQQLRKRWKCRGSFVQATAAVFMTEMRPRSKDKFPLMYNALQIQANPGNVPLASINQIQTTPVDSLHHHHHSHPHHDMTLRFKREFQSETDGENNDALLKLPSTTATTTQVASVTAPLIHSIKVSQEMSLEQQQQHEQQQHQQHWRPAESPLIRSFSEPVM